MGKEERKEKKVMASFQFFSNFALFIRTMNDDFKNLLTL